jgi:hypothetical protein
MEKFVNGYWNISRVKKASPSYNNICLVFHCLKLLTVPMMSTGPPPQNQQNFGRTSKIFIFYLELYKNEFKNLI